MPNCDQIVAARSLNESASLTEAPTLFQFQAEGAQWLVGKRYALLADEMGLGKSRQVIEAADRLNASPILVLCPAVARLNWAREFRKWSSRSLSLWPVLQKADIGGISSHDVVICSYDLASTTEVCSALLARRWSLLVLDEAHYLKSLEAGRAKAVLGNAGIIHNADRAWFLSGTPAPNHPGELWLPLYVCGVTKLTREQFLDRYTQHTQIEVAPGRWREKIVGARNVPDLRKLIAPFTLRRMKEEVMPQLPPIRFSNVVVEASSVPTDTWKMYFEGFLFRPERLQPEIEKGRRQVETLVNVIGHGGPPKDGNLQILEGLSVREEVKSLRKWTGLQKVPAVIELIKSELESKAYDKIVLFAVHKAVLEELRHGLRMFGAHTIYGGTPPRKRDKIVHDFQNDPRKRVLVGQVVAAGTAITLTAAAEVGVVEADWVPGNNSQAVMRCHRIGQTRSVNVRFFSIPGYDEVVSRVLKQKTRMLTALFDGPAEEESNPFD